MKYWLRKCIISLVLGSISAMCIMYFLNVDFAKTVNGPMHYLVFQSISLSAIFLAVYLLIKFIKETVKTKHSLSTLEWLGILMQMGSIFLIILEFFNLHFNFSFVIIGFILFCLGLITYKQKKHYISISFILWGVSLIIWIYTFSSASYSTWEVGS